MSKVIIRTIAVSAVLLLLLLGALQFHVEDSLAGATHLSAHGIGLGIGVLAWICGAVLACKLVQLLVWEQVGRKSGRRAPHLLVQISNVIIFFAMAMGMAGLLFKAPLTGAVATSSVLGLIIGFAVKSLISDTFSGIALNLDQGFSINDFIQIIGRGGTTRISGRVTQINWRSTYIQTPENSVMVIPNTVVSESVVLNYSKPEPIGEFEQVVTLDFEIPSERVVRVLNAAVHTAARENPAIFDCKARVSEITALGVTYKIKYMLNPAKLGPGKAKHFILSHVMRQLQLTGLAPSNSNYWNRDTLIKHHVLGEAEHRQRLLGRVSLFRELNESDLSDLAGRMTQRIFAPGQKLISVGDQGQSMFVLGEGLVSVHVQGEEKELDVATLMPGDFFGEMSMLTGEPRSASIIAVTETMVFEIDKDDLLPLLESNPDAADILSVAAAERRLASDLAMSAKAPAEIAAERNSLAGKILGAMTRFLGRRTPKHDVAGGAAKDSPKSAGAAA